MERKPKHFWLEIALAFVLAVLMTSPARSQSTTGDIYGGVADSSGAMVPDAKLTLTDQATKITVNGSTDAAGNFVFASVKPGTYTLTAGKEGFQRYVSTDIQLLVAQRARVDVTLNVGSVTPTVEIKAGATVLETASSTVGQVIGTRAIGDLPSNGRNFMQLTQLSPGVVPAGTGQDVSPSWTGRWDTSAVISGQRLEFVSFLLDGVESRGQRWGQAAVRPSVDAVQEFKMQRSTFSAEFGY